MPLGLNSGDRKLLAIGAALLVGLLAGTAVLRSRMGSRAEAPLVTSSASGGAKAVRLLLDASGYQTERWQRPPRDLDNAVTTVVVFADPPDAPTTSDRAAVRAFVEAGGRVIVTGRIGAFLVGSTAEADPIGALDWTRANAASATAITGAAPAITLARPAVWHERTGDTPLYADSEGTVAVRQRRGKGEVYWWSAATPLTNAGLREPGNLEFVLAQLGPPGERRIVFDEYFHGARPTLAGSVSHSPVRWLFAQAVLVFAAVLAAHARRSGPIAFPAPENRLAPLEFVQTLGSLYRRARAAAVPVEIATRRFRFWAARRAGVAAASSPEALARALVGRGRIDEASLVDTLRRCDEASGRDDLRPREALGLVRALAGQASDLGLFPHSRKEKR